MLTVKTKAGSSGNAVPVPPLCGVRVSVGVFSADVQPLLCPENLGQFILEWGMNLKSFFCVSLRQILS